MIALKFLEYSKDGHYKHSEDIHSMIGKTLGENFSILELL